MARRKAIEELVIEMSVDLRKLSKDLQVGQGKVESSSKKMANSFGAFGKSVDGTIKKMTSFKTLAAVGLAAGLGKLTANALKSADAIGQIADKVGVSTTFLQEFRFAAKQTGIEMNTADMALQRFARRLAEAGKGTGEAKAAFIELGIAVNDGNGNLRATEDVLREVADKLQAGGEAGDKLRIAFKLFDSEGAALVNTLRGGSEELDAFAREAERLGIILDENTVRNAKDLNAQLIALKLSAGTELTQALVDLSPILLKIAEAAGVAANAIKGLIDAAQPSASASDETLGARIRQRIGLLAQLNGAPEGTDLGLFSVGEAKERFGPALTANKNRLLAIQAQRAAARAAKTTSPRESAAAFEGPGAAEDQAAKTAATKALTDAKRLAEKQKQFQAKSLRDFLKATNQKIGLVQLEQVTKLQALDELKLSEQETADARVQINETAWAQMVTIQEDALKKQNEAAKKAAEELKDAWEDVGESVSGVFADMIREGEFSWRALAASLVESGLMGAIAKTLSGGTGGAGGAGGASLTSQVLGGLTGGTGGLVTAGLGALFGGGRAAGGPVRAGRAFRVNENTPQSEIFVPSSSGMIVPQGRGGGGDTEVNISVINATSAETTVQERRSEDKTDIQIMIGQAVEQDALTRGRASRATEKMNNLTRPGGRR